LLNSKDVSRPNRRRKRLRPSKRNSSVKLRLSWRLNRERLREERERWTARMRRGDSAWKKRTSERRKRVRSSGLKNRRKSRKSREGRSKFLLCRENSSKSVNGKLKKRGSSLSKEEKWRGWRWKGLLRRNNAKLRWLRFKTSSWKKGGNLNSFTNKP
jgi:hypothetical protein